MVDTTDLEKKSLEAHVDLCAQRYHFLEEKINGLDEKIDSVNTSVAEVKTTINRLADKNNDRLINWGIGIIVFLVGVIGYLIRSQF